MLPAGGSAAKARNPSSAENITQLLARIERRIKIPD
jgi:hypothetical protein